MAILSTQEGVSKSDDGTDFARRYHGTNGGCGEGERDAPWDRELKLVPGLARKTRRGLELKVARSGNGADADDGKSCCKFGLQCRVVKDARGARHLVAGGC